ncbi:hypothetical protein BH23BAC4_BH23BAC4_00660 [soil metagenome]
MEMEYRYEDDEDENQWHRFWLSTDDLRYHDSPDRIPDTQWHLLDLTDRVEADRPFYWRMHVRDPNNVNESFYFNASRLEHYVSMATSSEPPPEGEGSVLVQ